MKIRFLLLSAFLVSLGFSLVVKMPMPASAHGIEEHEHLGEGGVNEDLDQKKKEIEELRKKIAELEAEKSSLSSAIRFLDSKILLNEKEIEKTQVEIQILQAQIADLGQRIKGLEVSLHELSAALIERIQEQYKRGSTDGIAVVFAATGLNDFFKEHKYVSQVRAHTQDLMLATELKRQVYDEEKEAAESKQKEFEALQSRLQAQQQDLERQKADKRKFLEVTQSSEKVYQEKLANALAEFNAIQSIIAGGGKEVEAGKVKEGDTIANIISGRSVCSTGTHLHLEVAKNGVHVNPANYLRSEPLSWLNRDESFSLNGSWPWPVFDPAMVTQGYGMTSFARQGFYGGRPHTGIDMVSKTPGKLAVRAIADGTLYRGVYQGSSCKGLRYVRVKHSDELSSYYLHINY